MSRKISVWTAASLLILPATISAGALPGTSQTDLHRRVEELSRELDELKSQLAKQQETVDGKVDGISSKMEGMDKKVEDMSDKVGKIEKKSDDSDLATRFTFSGDFRSRLDYYSASGAEFINPVTGRPESRDYSSDSLLTNRFRFNMEAKATEDVTFKSRLAMYKVWGMEGYPRNDMQSWSPQFDGNSTRTPSDNALRVDRAFVNWANIADAPIWFSVGRRPTTDGMPAEVRLGTGKKMASTIAYMDAPFDGAVIGYDYGVGRLRYCYGRGFENGLQQDAISAQDLSPLDDTDFTGLVWDVFENDSRFLKFQSFVILNIFQRPDFADDSMDALMQTAVGENRTEGNLYHTTAAYEDKAAGLTYFLSGGWSRTEPGVHGLFNDYATSMLMQANGSMIANPNWQPNSSAENGFSLYAGLRYDIPETGLKIGAEYNYGSQYWIAFSPGHDDLYLSKLATRGHVAELYLIYDLPTGKAVSKYARTFLRLGWQHYWYDYTGIDWNIKPYDIENSALMTSSMMMATNSGSLMPVESADQVYLTLDVSF